MERSISIDDLTFGIFSLGADALVVEYVDSKADKKGGNKTVTLTLLTTKYAFLQHLEYFFA